MRRLTLAQCSARWRVLVGRWRQLPNPIFRTMIGLTAVMFGLSACAFSVIAGLTAFNWTWSQVGPGGLLSGVRVGRPAPDFTLAALDGREVSLSDYRGSLVAVNFWASWCLPCVVEIPELNAAVQEHGGPGFVVLGVNVGEQPERVAAFAAKNEMVYPVLLDSRAEVWEHYGGVDWPTTVWVDTDGLVRAVDLGRMDRRRIERRVATLGERGR